MITMKLAVTILTILLGLAVHAEPQSFRNAAPSGDSRPAASPFLRKRNAIEGRQAQLRKTEDDATEVRQAAEANQTAISQADPSKRLADKEITSGKKKYIYVANPTKSWHDARGECKKRGGDLASFLSYAEFEEVVEKFAWEIHWSVPWVGARMHLPSGITDVKNNWYWVTGEPLSPEYKKWYNDGRTEYPKDGSTSNQCAYIQSTGNMKEANGPSLYPAGCGGGARYLCEIPVKPSET